MDYNFMTMLIMGYMLGLWGGGGMGMGGGLWVDYGGGWRGYDLVRWNGKV